MRAKLLNAFEKTRSSVTAETGGITIQPATFVNYYLPLILHYITDREKKQARPYVIGIQGCQGVGKSTLTTLIKYVLRDLNYKIAGFSIDDFYLSWRARQALAKKYAGNAFYQVSRGMPGTHRYKALIALLEKAKRGKPFDIPVFDKSLHDGKGDVTDNVVPVREPQDFLILEGWCVDIPYVAPAVFPAIMARNEYVDALFREVDPQCSAYKIVLEYIAAYRRIRELLDNKTVMLGKDIRWVETWRVEQEERMVAIKGSGMSRAEVRAFVKPYIPFTWLYYDQILRDAGDIACLVEIGWEHLPEGMRIFSQGPGAAQP